MLAVTQLKGKYQQVSMEVIFLWNMATKNCFSDTRKQSRWNLLDNWILTSINTSWETLGWKKHKLEIMIDGRNINNLRYADDTTLMAESEEELKCILMKVKEESEKLA